MSIFDDKRKQKKEEPYKGPRFREAGFAGGNIQQSGSGGAALTVKEIDAVPTVGNVTTIRVTNGTLVDDGGGQVTLTIGGAGLNDPGANGVVVRTALNTTTARTLTGTLNRIVITNGDGVAGNPTFDVGSLVGITTQRIDQNNAATTSAQLATVISDETGSGLLVFGTSPTITTPTISGAISFPDDVRQTFNPGATVSGLNVGSQAGDPSTPINGDIWYDSTGNLLRARINGVTVSLGAGGGGSPGGSNTQVQYNNAGAFGGSAAITLSATEVTGTMALDTAAAITWEADTSLFRDAVRTVGLRGPSTHSGTSEFFIYGSFTSSTQFRRLRFAANASDAFIGTAHQNEANIGLNFQIGASTFGGMHPNGSWDFGAGPSDVAQIRSQNQSTSKPSLRLDSASGATVTNFLSVHTIDNTSTPDITAQWNANSSGAAATGFGQIHQFNLETTTTNDTLAADTTITWTDATHASRKAREVFNIYDTAAREGLRIEASGTAPMIGFLGASAAARQTSGANLTNDVTSGGTNDVIPDFQDLSTYANDAALIRNGIYQLARKLKQVNDALRLYGLLT